MCLRSALDIPSQVDALDRISHLLFRDFLVDPTKRTRNDFWIDEINITGCLRIDVSELWNNISREISAIYKCQESSDQREASKPWTPACHRKLSTLVGIGSTT